MSLWAPASASSSSTGLRPTNTAAAFAERPMSCAAFAINATAPRLASTAIAFNVQTPAATPSGAIAYVKSVNNGPYGECWRGQPMNRYSGSAGACAATWV